MQEGSREPSSPGERQVIYQEDRADISSTGLKSNNSMISPASKKKEKIELPDIDATKMNVRNKQAAMDQFNEFDQG